MSLLPLRSLGHVTAAGVIRCCRCHVIIAAMYTLTACSSESPATVEPSATTGGTSAARNTQANGATNGNSVASSIHGTATGGISNGNGGTTGAGTQAAMGGKNTGGSSTMVSTSSKGTGGAAAGGAGGQATGGAEVVGGAGGKGTGGAVAGGAGGQAAGGMAAGGAGGKGTGGAVAGGAGGQAAGGMAAGGAGGQATGGAAAGGAGGNSTGGTSGAATGGSSAVTLPPLEDFTDTVGSASVDMVYIPGGTFTLGCESDTCDPDTSPVENITVSPYHIMRTEVSKAMWSAVGLTEGNWYDCVAVACEFSKKTGHAYRMMTEAEFEYAAKNHLSKLSQIDATEEWAFNSWETKYSCKPGDVDPLGPDPGSRSQKTRRDKATGDKITGRLIRSMDGIGPKCRLTVSAKTEYPPGYPSPCYVEPPKGTIEPDNS